MILAQLVQRVWGTGHKSAHPGRRKESCNVETHTRELEMEKLEFKSWLPGVLCDTEQTVSLSVLPCLHLAVSPRSWGNYIS